MIVKYAEKPKENSYKELENELKIAGFDECKRQLVTMDIERKLETGYLSKGNIGKVKNNEHIYEVALHLIKSGYNRKINGDENLILATMLKDYVGSETLIGGRYNNLIRVSSGICKIMNIVESKDTGENRWTKITDKALEVLSIIKDARKKYTEDSAFYYQAESILKPLLIEVDSNKTLSNKNAKKDAKVAKLKLKIKGYKKGKKKKKGTNSGKLDLK